MDETAAERAEEEALLQAQVESMRWRAQLPGDLPRLTLRRALRRIHCPHIETRSMTNEELCVWWCERCGHSEVALAPLAPDERWFPKGKPAWSST